MPYQPSQFGDRGRGRDRDHDRDHDHHRDHWRGYGSYGWAGVPLWTGWYAPFLPNYPLFYGDVIDQDDYDSSASYPNDSYPGSSDQDQYAQQQPAYGYPQDDSRYPSQDPGVPPPGQASDYTGSYGTSDGRQDAGAAPVAPPYNPGVRPAPYQPSTQDQQQSRMPYHPSAATAAPPAALEAPLTLVFKDGRPPQKIRNYLLTSTTLSVLDQQRRDIPVDQIDLVQTAEVNRKAGIDFQVPGSQIPALGHP